MSLYENLEIKSLREACGTEEDLMDALIVVGDLIKHKANALGIFGSRRHLTHHPESDLDLLVLAKIHRNPLNEYSKLNSADLRGRKKTVKDTSRSTGEVTYTERPWIHITCYDPEVLKLLRGGRFPVTTAIFNDADWIWFSNHSTSRRVFNATSVTESEPPPRHIRILRSFQQMIF